MTGASKKQNFISKLPYILLVDDDPVLCEIAATNLMNEGFDVVYVNNGAEALEQLSSRDFDLVITDLEMPEMDGLELTRAIRSRAAIGNVPVIVITGKNQTVAVDEAFSAGATSFLSKPLNWELFTRSVRFVLQAAFNEKSLRIAKDEAKSAADLKQSILSNLSHEMRTPLNHIVGFAEVLTATLSQQGNEEERNYAEYIAQGGRRLNMLLSDMMFLSVAETDGIVTERSSGTPGEILKNVSVNFSESLAAKGSSLTLAAEEEDTNLVTDTALLSQALSKLVDNAIKFSPDNSRIKLGFLRQPQSGAPMFFVQDQGPGVPEDFLPQLGQLFSQAKMGLNRNQEGMGTGLRICALIAEALGGEMKYANLQGGGLMAALVLPDSVVDQTQLARTA